MQFQKLVSRTIKSLIRQNVPLDQLVAQVMTLGAFKPVFKKSQAPLFLFCFQKLQAADTIPKIFLILKDYFSFFNYHIIEHIIKELGTKKDKDKLQMYRYEFDRYARRRIFECQPEFGAVSDTDHANIFMKLDSQYDYYTVAEVERFCHKLSKILCVSSQGTLRLCLINEGCFQLTFQVPSFVQQEIFPLSREQELALEEEGVLQLICGKCQFPDYSSQDNDITTPGR